MAANKLNLILAALVFAGAATGFIVQHRTQLAMRNENQTLRQQIDGLQAGIDDFSNRVLQLKAARIAPVIAGPAPCAVSPKAALPAQLPVTNLYALITNRTTQVKLTAAQLEGFLRDNQRNAGSLLAAYRTSSDPAFLREAMEKYPTEPLVGFEAALAKDAPPAERRQWLDAFKQSAPENALANYLSAADHFKAGETDLAVQEMLAAAGKTQFQDYALDRIQGAEEAYRAADLPEAEAKALASAQLLHPDLVQVRALAGNLVDLAASYQQKGDESSRQATLGMAVDLGQRFDSSASGATLLAQMLGISVERTALGAMDPNAAYGANGQTVQDRLTQLAQQRASMRELATQADPLLQSLSGPDWISYQDRSAHFGEEAAMRWLVGKHPTP
jgi:hypothetical protein